MKKRKTARGLGAAWERLRAKRASNGESHKSRNKGKGILENGAWERPYVRRAADWSKLWKRVRIRLSLYLTSDGSAIVGS